MGLGLLPAIAWIPILGWAAWLALVLAALGSVSRLVYRGVWPGCGPQAAETGSPKAA